MDNKQFICETIEKCAEAITSINRSVWDYAEFGYEEEKSAQKLVQVLRDNGFTVETGIAGIETAFVATFGSGAPVIGILAEFDALPGLSQEAGCPEPRPLPGKDYGHGCGHSALGAGSVGAVLAVKAYLEAGGRPGTIRLYGCPAEETGFGKAFMAKAGSFAGLDMAFSWHPMDQNALMARNVGYYKVRFDFIGHTSHAGAAPELGRSALDASELMNTGVQYLREHVISSARIHYAYLDAGGKAPNIVQDHASLLYFVRAPKLSQSAEILERIKKVAQGAALMTETEVKVTVLGGMSDNIPNPTASRLLLDCYREVGGPDFGEEEFAIARRFLEVLPKAQRERALAIGAKASGCTPEAFAKRPLITAVPTYDPRMLESVSTGSTDVGDVSYLVPTAQITAAIGIPTTGAHTWQFTAQVGTTIGDKGAKAAARALAFACTRIYEDPTLVERAKAELLEETGGAYHSPIPDGITPKEAM